jgi:hypothetical protein
MMRLPNVGLASGSSHPSLSLAVTWEGVHCPPSPPAHAAPIPHHSFIHAFIHLHSSSSLMFSYLSCISFDYQSFNRQRVFCFFV